MSFAHLHVHSQFSILAGVPAPKKLVEAAAKQGMPALALTDTCNLYGAVEHYKACKDKKIRPVFGTELWVDPRGIGTREGGLAGCFNLVLLVEDDLGYQNVCELVTSAIFDGIYHRPRVDLDRLRKHGKGLFCLLGNGETGVVRRDGRDENLRTLLDVFGVDRVFGELMDHGFDWQAEVNDHLRAMSRQHGFRNVVTNQVRYLEPTDAVRLDLLGSIGFGASLQDARRPRVLTDQQYFKSEAEIRDLFAGDADAIDRTVELAEACHYKYPSGIYYFPSSVPPDKDGDSEANWRFFLDAFPPSREFPIPAEKPAGGGQLGGYFRWFALAGLELRLQFVGESRHAEYRERCERELGMIVKMGFAAYLLIVAEFINWAKDREIPVGPGRGSAAGSIVAWAMRITDIDPMRFALLFERFLNPERVSMPDIDVDFAQDRREEVIAHVRDKYGAPLVAQIITYGKLQAKAALKDVARVCDLSFNDSDRITKLVPEVLNITIDDALKQEAKLRHLQTTEPRTSRVIALARSIEGAVRQTGVHAAGVVIADRPLVQITPLYRDGPEGGPVVQYDMKSAESIGLIKFDFLGLKTLDQVRDAVDMVERNTGQKVDIARVDEDDPATWALLQRGDTFGVFQVEGEGIRGMLTKLRPASLEDLVAAVALYRPGPLSSGMVDDFIDRKHGRKLVEYAFPELEPILSSTYGTIVYQEQVMQCAQVLAGYSLGEADLLRRAMGKKDAVEMGRQKTRFVNGAVAAGHNEQKASDLFDLLAKFAEYGFNKSHSAAYGFVAFQTAWLKANHRAEYMAALMSIDAGNSDKVLVYVGDCRRASIKILPPDVNASLGRFDVPREDRRSIRFGLHAVKGVGEGAVEAIVVARAGGRFTDLMDLLRRVDAKKANKKVWESLIKSGSLDSFGEPRARLAAALEDAMAAASEEQAQKASGQTSLFGGAAVQRPAFRMPTVGEWTVGERMKAEKEALGLFLTGHPVSAFAAEIERLGFKRVGDVPLLPISERKFGRAEDAKGDGAVSICAIVVSKRVIRNKNGDPMCFVTFEDMDGTVDGTLFADVLARSQAALDSGRPLAVRARVEQREGKPRGLRVLGLELMEDLRERVVSKVEIRLRSGELTDDSLAKLRELVAQSTGECRTKILVNGEGYAATLRVGRRFSVRATPKFVDGVRSLFGRTDALVLEE